MRSSPLIALSLALAASGALAQEDPARRGFDPDPPRPAATLEGGLVLETAEARPAHSYRAELLFDYARGLLALRQGDSKVGDLLVDRLQAHLLAGYSLGRLQLALGLPVALHQGANLSLLTGAGLGGPLVAPVASFAVGDLRGVAKLALLDETSSKLLSLAVALEARAPTGNAQAFFSDGLMAIPSVLASRRFGPARLDANLGYVVRGQGQYLQLVVHDALAYGLGATVELPRLGPVEGARALLELNGQLPRGIDLSTERYRAPLEARLGLRAKLWSFLFAEVGVGAGLALESGYGRERFRVFGGLRWDYTFVDRDGDGVPDDRDRCPDTPGQARYQGCVDGDSDGDGLMDSVDRCPAVRGLPEYDGCPDSDGDGIPDDEDKCPTRPGPAEADGCPVERPPLVILRADRLELRAGITFDTGKDTIKKDSLPVLEEVAQILHEHPELKLVRVEGHTDNVGSAVANKNLSQRRAQSVVRYLVSKGIAAQRLIARGYGEEKPITTNATGLGRAKNRRVEFTLLKEEDRQKEEAR